MTNYPRDEFDRVPESAARQGVHREHFLPTRSSGLWLKIVVGVLVLLLGLAAYFVLPRLGAGETEPASGSVPTSGTETPEFPAASGTASATGVASEASGTTATPTPARTGSAASPSASATKRAGTKAPAAPDRTQAVNVLNGTGVPGLAASAAGRLAAGGWSAAVPGNWTGSPVQGSVVFYNGETQRASAAEAASVLGIASVVDAAGVPGNITVVLGPGFQ